MDQFKDIIEVEEERISHIVGEMGAILTLEQADRQGKDREISELKRRKLDAVDWREKREIDEMIDRSRGRYAMRHYQDSKILSQPYFGILELEDDALGAISTCLGRQSFFDRNGKALVIDWRDAPISRLYYEYDAGELYEEEIRGRDRSGVVKGKRQVDTSGGELRKVMEKGTLLVRREDGSWQRADGSGGVISGKEEKADHRLPEITALISRDQFRAITHPESSTVLLQGGAGSGKTTIGLHRIAYLAYQDKERFQPNRVLVVMFNRSLQQYISRVLPELGIEAGVQVETYHSWAGKRFRAAGLQIAYSSDPVPPEVARLKKQPVMLLLVERYLDALLEKSRNWLLEQLEHGADPDLEKIKAHLGALTRFEDFPHTLNTHPDFAGDAHPEIRRRLRTRLLRRFDEHALDLYTLLSDRLLVEDALGKDCHGDPVDRNALDQLIQWQTKLRDRSQVDFADAGILLWLMQRKGLSIVRPGYAHIMVDEAQDLSEVELATLLLAADEHQSITICGDMAQKIKGDVSFDSGEGFAGFVRDQQKRTGAGNLRADTLVVGYRATRPIMELAWHVLGEKPSMAVPRDGDPVRIIQTLNNNETIAEAKKILDSYLQEHPKSLVAVVCRYKTDADRVFEDLRALGLSSLRRHARDDFSFQPGVIVTNAHQVKGLEFSAVLVVNPGTSQYRDDRENRMLLHVVITRAADNLWMVGHRAMAYGIDTWLENALSG